MKDLETTELKSWRKRLGMSQQKLAELARVSLATIRQLEVGKHAPRRKTLGKILDAVKRVEKTPTLAIGPKRGRRPKSAVVGADSGIPQIKRGPGRPPKSASFGVDQTITGADSPPIRLSNLDLELINRILNMTGRQKLDLLRKLT